MKKRFLLLLTTMFLMSFGMTSSIMAKSKKIVYLGHNYKGEVNDQMVPSGKGNMIVNGLVIEGVFDNQTVTDAQVSLSSGFTSFKGTITYDESDNITMKAGGIVSTRYYQSNGEYFQSGVKCISIQGEPKSADETLEKDRIANSSTFETKELKMPYNIDNNAFRTLEPLNLPKFTAYYTVGLAKVGRYNGQPVNVNVFVEPLKEKINNTVKIENFKDSQGRLWNVIFTPNTGRTDWVNERNASDYKVFVKYPNGSNLSYERKYKGGNVYYESMEWEIHYPNGKIVKAAKIGSMNLFVDFGKVQFDGGNQRINNVAYIFVENMAKDSFFVTENAFGSYRDLKVTSNTIDLEKLSNNEIAKLLQENVVPCVKDVDIVVYSSLAASEGIGRYSKGVYTSKKQYAEAEAKAKEAEQKKKEAEYDKLCKTYGKKYVDEYYSGNIIVGMPEGFIKRSYHKLKSVSGTSKIYYLLPYAGAPESRRTCTVWISNGKVTSFVLHN